MAKGMPVDDAEAQMLLHRYPLDHFILVVPVKCQWVGRVGTLVANFFDIGKCSHVQTLTRDTVGEASGLCCQNPGSLATGCREPRRWRSDSFLQLGLHRFQHRFVMLNVFHQLGNQVGILLTEVVFFRRIMVELEQ